MGDPEVIVDVKDGGFLFEIDEQSGAIVYEPKMQEIGIIPSSEAIKTAEVHFYLNYAEDGDGFEYIMELPNLTKDCWEIRFRKEYASGELEKRAYYYAIDKFTGEIISMTIDE